MENRLFKVFIVCIVALCLLLILTMSVKNSIDIGDLQSLQRHREAENKVMMFAMRDLFAKEHITCEHADCHDIDFIPPKAEKDR